MKTYRGGMVMAACVCAAAVCSAQWFDQRLNDFAVTNEFGEMIVLCDEGGPYGGNLAVAAGKAFDGDVNTFYDAAWGNNAWAGFGLESPKVITRVRYTGRNGQGGRTGGVLIQGANTADFSDAETIFTLPPPPNNWNVTTWLESTFNTRAALKAYAFVRFLAPTGNGGNFTQVEFYGNDPAPAAPAAPVVVFEGSINWRMNLFWDRANTTVILYEVQRKFSHEADFGTVAEQYYTGAGTTAWRDMSLRVYQDTLYRLIAHNTEGSSTSATFTACASSATPGEWIGTQGSYQNGGMTGARVFEGDVNTYYDAVEGSGNWTGLDFGEAKDLVGLRFVPRRTFPGRMVNGWFEAADDPDFTNPILLNTITNQPSISAVSEEMFDIPVTARYARYCSPNGQYGNIAELEFVQAPVAPRPPQDLSVTGTEPLGGDAVLTWTLNNVGSVISSVMVYRATSPGGPYTLVTPEGIDGLTWTDTGISVGIRYYYKVAALVNADPAPLEGEKGPHVSFISCIHIERDEHGPNGLTAIRPEMSLLGLHYPVYQAGREIDKMFDNSVTSFVDLYETNPAIGVDLAAPYCVRFFRFAARNSFVPRLNGAELYGTNDPDYTNMANATRLGTFQVGVAEQLITLQTEIQKPFRYIFIYRSDGVQWNGNINELELYGWSGNASDHLILAPDPVHFTILPGGVRLDWDVENGAQESYRIERSADGEGWSILGTTQGDTFTDPSPVLHQRMLYRVVAVGPAPEEEEAYSDAYPVIAYAAATGAGLWANYYTNFYLAYNTAEAFAMSVTAAPTPNQRIPGGARLHPDIPATQHVRVVWHGDLTVPFDGDYTFWVTVDDGCALWLDGDCLVNKWSGGAVTTQQATRTLTGGVYRVRLDYYQDAGDSAIILEWGGAVERAVIPTVQFTPVAPPEGTDVFQSAGPWQGRTFNAPRLGWHRLNPDGSVTVASAGGDLSGTGENHHFVWQRLTLRDFVFEATLNMHIDPQYGSGKGYLMVRNDLPVGMPFIAPAAIADSNTGRFNVKQRLPGNANVADAGAWAGPMLNPFRLRLTRAKGVFTYAYREDTPGAPWVAFDTAFGGAYMYDDTAALFGNELYIGFGVCAPGTPANMHHTVTFSDISIRPLGNGTVLLLR